jgi:hypothetical protein
LHFDAARLVRRLLEACLFLEVIFVLLDYHVSYGRLTTIGALRRLTAIAREDGLASWFGTTQTLLVALTAWTILSVVRAQEAARWRQSGWAVVAMLFTYMAVDDGAQIHERVGTTVRMLQGRESAALAFFPSYTWQVVFGPLFALLGLFVAAFLWRELSDRATLALVLAALGCFGLAVGLDFIEGLDRRHPLNLYSLLTARTDVDAWAADRFGRSGFQTLDHFGRSLEEFLEMVGGTLFWGAFLRTLTSLTPEIRLRWSR